MSLNNPLRQRVFEYVRAHGRAARADITRALGISAGSATTLTADLIKAGYLRQVAEIPRESEGRGRPPVALEVVPDAGYVLGIKLADERHTAVLSDFAGGVVSEQVLDVSLSAKSLVQMLDEIEQLVGALLSQCGIARAQIRAVGIGIAGIVDHETGRVHWSPLLDQGDVHFKDAFEARFKLPCLLENDANMLTLAEQWFGTGRELTDFAVVTIQNGVGMGMVLNNQLYRGSWGMGLELGHTKVQIDGALCRCGQRGCLEAYLADYALVREAATALNYPINAEHSIQSVLSALFEEATAGNTAAQKIFQRAGRFLALGLSNVVQLFDPALIILSGERTKYDVLDADDIVAEVHALTLSRGQSPCKVEVHSWSDTAWARGATARALSSVSDGIFAAEALG